jgi:sulfopyruvate decarboxylase subunit alpha
MTIDSDQFRATIKFHGYTLLSGVPDSTFGSAYDALTNDPEIRFVPAVREDVALGIASAAHLAGRKGAVMMQNSGIGNVINALTSFNLIYRIPALLIIGWRGYGGPPNDAPEHWVMGTNTPKMLELLEIPYEVMEPESFEAGLERLLAEIDELSVPGALLVRAGVLS